MNLTDIAQQVTSWLSDLEIKKLYTTGLISTLSFSRSNSWWHARVETLSGVRMQYESTVNYKQVYQIISTQELGIWNEYDNLTACKILERMGHKPIYNDMIQSCRHGTEKIMSHLLAHSNIDPCLLINSTNTRGDILRVPIWESVDALSLAVWNSQPAIVSLLLQDQRVDPTMNMMGLHDSSVIEDACSSTCPSQDISGKTSLNNNPIERQVAVVKLLLADGRIVLTVEELYSCIHAEILQVLLDEQLAASNGTVDPTVESNKPLRQAILRENEGMVRVYLADERVAKLVNAETVRLAKNYSTPAIFELVVKHARLNSGR